jgi:hypothetical protein
MNENDEWQIVDVDLDIYYLKDGKRLGIEEVMRTEHEEFAPFDEKNGYGWDGYGWHLHGCNELTEEFNEEFNDYYFKIAAIFDENFRKSGRLVSKLIITDRFDLEKIFPENNMMNAYDFLTSYFYIENIDFIH